jgi:omega-amidase
MKLALVQKHIADTDLRRHCDRLAGHDIDLIAFGELATSGCIYESNPGAAGEDLLAPLKGVRTPVLVGREGESLYNSYCFLDGDTRLVYNKINLFEPFNEPGVYKPGMLPGLFDTRFGRFGVGICYDIRFPELFSLLKQEGAEFVFVPAAFPRVRVGDYRRLLVERAVDNEFTVVGINAVGDDGVNEFGGSSMVVTPEGRILVQADETSETTLEVEL